MKMKIFKSNKEIKSIIKEISKVALCLWQRGWAERNAGNISVNISELLLIDNQEYNSLPYFDLPVSYNKLAGNYFLVTGTGRRMRDIAGRPSANTLLIKLNEKANGYWILTQKSEDIILMPTSELPTHLGIHQMISAKASQEKVVLHTHATELIAITQAKEYCNQKALNSILMQMHPETSIFIPKGVGFVPYCLPGSEEIAARTLKELEIHDIAIWEKHGVFAIGSNVTETFDCIDILAKSARIFLMCKSANIIPEGFTDEQLAELKKLTDRF
jgi:rhamnulose-1-phosphate aldolase